MLLFGGIGKGNIFGYSRPSVYCSFDLVQEPLSYIDQMINALSVACPPIIATFSLAVFLVIVLRKNQVSRMNKYKRQAAVTMVIFTTLFLVCNLPCLLNNILWFMTEMWYEYPEPFYQGKFMFFYSWLISDVVCTVLNATLNPVLYFCRMKGLRNWFKSRESSMFRGSFMQSSAHMGPRPSNEP
jgi:hypothetical protein